MTKIERASQNVNLAIEAVAEQARVVNAHVHGMDVTHAPTVRRDDVHALRAAITAWDDATKALLRLYGKPEAHAPEGEEGDAPVPA
jgi:hypothetical protein